MSNLTFVPPVVPHVQVPLACDLSQAPSEAILFQNTSLHPWCIACDTYYHDVCMVLSSLLEVPTNDKKKLKQSDLPTLFIVFEKIRLILWEMVHNVPFKDPVTTTNADMYAEFHKTLFLTVENICAQLLHCIIERVKHHNTCILPPTNPPTPQTRFGNFGDERHAYILGLYAAEFFCFYTLYKYWIDMLNLKLRQYHYSALTSSSRASDEIAMLHMIMCAAFPTKSDLLTYINTRKATLASQFKVIPHEDFEQYIQAHLYTKECESFPSTMSATDAYIKKINSMPSFVTNRGIQQFERFLSDLIDNWDQYCVKYVSQTNASNITSKKSTF